MVDVRSLQRRWRLWRAGAVWGVKALGWAVQAALDERGTVSQPEKRCRRSRMAGRP